MNRPVTDALAWALIHFLWQGALIALLAGPASLVLRRARSTTRYGVFCGALVLMAILPVATFLIVEDSAAPAASVAVVPPAATASASSAPVAAAAPAPAGPPAWLPWLVRVWFAGVVLLALRSAGGWLLAQRLKHWKSTPASDEIQRMAARLRARLDIRRMVRVFESTVAEVPSAIGWLRPVILLPVSALTALTPGQIELLLAHELAHIRRYDYLINLLQTAVETMLFYHPAVWWISAQIRAERENCCDDLAVQACGDAVAYARTLAQLEGLRTRPLQLALAADGGSLLSRVQRLLNRDGARKHTPPAWVGALLPVAVVLIAVLSVRPTRVAATQGPDLDEQGRVVALPRGPVPSHPKGYLGGLAAAGYTQVSVEEIIRLKENGVDPRYISEMMSAGLGTPSVEELIKLHQNGVDPAFVTKAARAGLAKDLTFLETIALRGHGVDPEEMGRIRQLGFGPFRVDDITRMKDHGVGHEAFAALQEAGVSDANVKDAIELQENGVSAATVRSMRDQGFGHLTIEQIIKLKRAGVI